MKKRVLLIVGLWLSFTQLKAQYLPQFSFDRDYAIGNLVSYSPYSFVLYSSFSGTRYETYIEGLHQNIFYAKQKVIEQGKPPISRELSTLEMSRLPHMHLLYYASKATPDNDDILLKSWRISPQGFRTSQGNHLPEAKVMNFEIRHLARIPYSRLDYRRLHRLKQHWHQARQQWKNTYTYVLRTDSVSATTGKAIGIKKVVKVRNGKIVQVKAFKVEQNWLGNTDKKNYKSEPLPLSKAELQATLSLDEFYEQALAVLQQSRHASLDQPTHPMNFTLHQFRPSNQGVMVYALESVMPN